MKTQYRPTLPTIHSPTSSGSQPQMAEIKSPPSVDWSIESTAGTEPRKHEGPIAHEGVSIKSRLMRIFCCGAK